MRDNLVRGGDGQVRRGSWNASFRLRTENDQIDFSQIRQIQNPFTRFTAFDKVFRLAPRLGFGRHELPEQLF